MTLQLDIRRKLGAFTLDAKMDAGPGVTALFGPSGAGKSTLVKSVAGLTRPDAGRIALGGDVLFDGERGIWVPAHLRRIGVVFQDARLFPHLNVRNNLRYGARCTGDVDAAEESRVAHAFGISTLMQRKPATLSGGEQSRVALARAVLMRPRLLLLDEPLAALDEPRKLDILPYLERIRNMAGIPVLFVSHSVAEVARLADDIVLMQEGRVARAGVAEDLLSDPGLMSFFGPREAGAVLRVVVEAHEADGLSRCRFSGGVLTLPEIAAAPGTLLRLRVQAADVILAREAPVRMSVRNILPAVVETITRGHGPGVAVALRCGDDRLLARVTARAAADLDLAPGVDCFAILKATAIPRGDVGGA